MLPYYLEEGTNNGYKISNRNTAGRHLAHNAVTFGRYGDGGRSICIQLAGVQYVEGLPVSRCSGFGAGMKKSISWHMECLSNRYRAAAEKAARIKKLELEMERLNEENDFYRSQIDTAWTEGKDSFDRDKYLVGRKEKT